MDLTVVLTSAAVSAVVSGLFTFVSQWRERRARRQELLIKTAADLAGKQFEQGVALATHMGRELRIPDVGMLTYEYYRQLSSMMKHGKLTPEAQKSYEDYMKTRGSMGVEETAP